MTIRSRTTRCSGIACSALLFVASAAAQNEQPIDPLNEAQLVSEAEQAMNDGAFERAGELWDALRERKPQSPQIPFNMGVAAYRQGDYDRAAELFSQALSMTSDPALRRDSAYNLGTSAYAQSLSQPSSTPASGATEQLDRASEELQRALEHYRQALDVSPNDADARANAELAYRRLQNLEAMKRQLQQSQPDQQQQPDQNQQQNDDQQDQQQQQNDQQQDDQQQNNQQQSDQSQQDQQQQNENQNQDQQQSSQSQAQPEQPENQNQQESPQPNDQQSDNQDQQPSAGEQPDQPDQPEPPQQSDASSPNQPSRGGMTKEEAERLLQMVRDKQRRRQEQRKQEQASRLPPVDKDW